MRKALFPAVAILVMAATTACSGPASEPTAVDTAALIETADAWTPAAVTSDLQVDEATRQEIEAGLRTLHASLLDLRARHEAAEALDGSARAAYMAELEEEVRAIHEQHKALWDSLDPAVREALAARLHERMREEHDDPSMKSLHERMRRLHGDGEGHGAGH